VAKEPFGKSLGQARVLTDRKKVKSKKKSVTVETRLGGRKRGKPSKVDILVVKADLSQGAIRWVFFEQVKDTPLPSGQWPRFESGQRFRT